VVATRPVIGASSSDPLLSCSNIASARIDRERRSIRPYLFPGENFFQERGGLRRGVGADLYFFLS
jgi:hypothetical protein